MMGESSEMGRQALESQQGQGWVSVRAWWPEPRAADVPFLHEGQQASEPEGAAAAVKAEVPDSPSVPVREGVPVTQD